jgi:hypothetical protein
MKPGDIVRRPFRKRTATVIAVLKLPRHKRMADGVLLDDRLEGFRYWNMRDLELVEKSK